LNSSAIQLLRHASTPVKSNRDRPAGRCSVRKWINQQHLARYVCPDALILARIGVCVYIIYWAPSDHVLDESTLVLRTFVWTCFVHTPRGLHRAAVAVFVPFCRALLRQCNAHHIDSAVARSVFMHDATATEYLGARSFFLLLKGLPQKRLSTRTRTVRSMTLPLSGSDGVVDDTPCPSGRPIFTRRPILNPEPVYMPSLPSQDGAYTDPGPKTGLARIGVRVYSWRLSFLSWTGQTLLLSNPLPVLDFCAYAAGPASRRRCGRRSLLPRWVVPVQCPST